MHFLVFPQSHTISSCIILSVLFLFSSLLLVSRHDYSKVDCVFRFPCTVYSLGGNQTHHGLQRCVVLPFSDLRGQSLLISILLPFSFFLFYFILFDSIRFESIRFNSFCTRRSNSVIYVSWLGKYESRCSLFPPEFFVCISGSKKIGLSPNQSKSVKFST